MNPSDESPHLDAYIKRRRQRRFAGMVIVLMLATTPIAVLISSRAFDIAVTPADAAQSAVWHRETGKLLILGSRVLLFSPTGTVLIEADGYAPHAVEIDKNGDRQQLAAALEPLPGIAVITVVSPDDFELSVDDITFGTTYRLKIELERGPHSVHIRGEQIKPLTAEIDITGYGETQHFKFETEPGNSTLTLATAPVDAQVFLDGALVGRGRYEGVIPLGDHEVTVKRDGYHEQRRSFAVGPEQRIDLGVIELSPKAARLALASKPSGAAVLLNGEFAGTTPVRLSVAPLQPHQLTIRKTGHEPLETRIEAAPGQLVQRSFRLGGQTYQASVTADVDAQVTVNGVDQGTTPVSIAVREGDRIEVSRQGYSSQQVVVDPVGGDQRAYAFKMLRPKEYAFQQAPAQISLDNGIALRKFPPATISLPPANGDSPVIAKELTRPFYMGLREVAYREYLAFDQRPIPRGLSPGHPVTNLTWTEAAKFCNWLSDQEGMTPVYEFDGDDELRRIVTDSLGYRLPTEAEWEAVAGYDFAGNRAVGAYPWGQNPSIPRAFANFAGREAEGQGRGKFLFEHVDNHSAAAPVGSYPANVNGLYDLAGNVAEWVTDFYAPLPANPTAPLVDPMGPRTGIDHLVKGSSFRTDKLAKLAVAERALGVGKSDAVGFRIARWIY